MVRLSSYSAARDGLAALSDGADGHSDAGTCGEHTLSWIDVHKNSRCIACLDG